ncbi:MAG: ABC transporter permease subunit [Anaerolineales bacterium]|nr:ABC transporter permease subunit [Anaerolineales bacterium]
MNALVVAKREFETFLVSPTAYLIGAFFLFITGIVFSFNIVVYERATLAPVFETAGVSLIFFIPILMSHLLVREFQRGTLELLMTSPVAMWEIVLGKFLAAFLFLMVILAPTVAYLFILIYYGQPDLPVIWVGYLGLLLFGGLVISLVVLSSAMCTSQLTAIILSITLAAFFWLIGRLDSVINGEVGTILAYLSSQHHFLDFVVGIMTLSNITYFITMIVGVLYLTTHILKMRL